MTLFTVKNSELKPDVEFNFRQCLRAIESVAKRAVNGSADLGKLDDVLARLETLPLTTGEYGTFRNRMLNARKYLIARERAAAAYELRMVRRMLSRHVAP